MHLLHAVSGSALYNNASKDTHIQLPERSLHLPATPGRDPGPKFSLSISPCPLGSSPTQLSLGLPARMFQTVYSGVPPMYWVLCYQGGHFDMHIHHLYSFLESVNGFTYLSRKLPASSFGFTPFTACILPHHLPPQANTTCFPSIPIPPLQTPP